MGCVETRRGRVLATENPVHVWIQAVRDRGGFAATSVSRTPNPEVWMVDLDLMRVPSHSRPRLGAGWRLRASIIRFNQQAERFSTSTKSELEEREKMKGKEAGCW